MSSPQRPSIKIPDLQLEIREFFQEFREKVTILQSSFNTYSSVVIGVMMLGFLVLLFALVTLIIQSWQFYSTFQSESTQLKIQSDIINNNIKQQKSIEQSQYDIKKELDQIKKQLEPQ